MLRVSDTDNLGLVRPVGIAESLCTALTATVGEPLGPAGSESVNNQPTSAASSPSLAAFFLNSSLNRAIECLARLIEGELGCPKATWNMESRFVAQTGPHSPPEILAPRS